MTFRVDCSLYRDYLPGAGTHLGCDFVTDVVTSPWLAGSRSTGCARQPRGPSRRMAIRPPKWGDRTQCVVGASQGPRSRPFVWGHFSNGHSRRNSHGDNGRRRLCAGHSRVSPGAREHWTVGRVVEVAPEPPGALQGSESQGSLGQQPGRAGAGEAPAPARQAPRLLVKREGRSLTGLCRDNPAAVP